jgi:hypothetical protein
MTNQQTSAEIASAIPEFRHEPECAAGLGPFTSAGGPLAMSEVSEPAEKLLWLRQVRKFAHAELAHLAERRRVDP